MKDDTARFTDAPIGASLSITGGGYELSTLVDGASIGRSARSDLPQSAGVHGVEFYFYGDDAGLSAAIGIVTPAAALTTYVGGNAAGIGWRLDDGTLRQNGAVLASGLPTATKGDLLGVVLALDSAATARLELYKGRTLVYTYALGALGTWHFAASIGTATAGGTRCIVNAGQWSMQTGAMRTGGWAAPSAVLPPVRLSDMDWLSAPTDTPANTRYDGVIDQTGFDSLAAVSFWPWGERGNARASVGQVTVLDADGRLDALAGLDVRGQPVRVRQVEHGQALASADDYGRFVLERIEIADDSRKTFFLRDSHDDLDDPLQRTPFLPFMSASEAWTPQPIVIGACLSVPAVAVSSDGALQWLADTPLGNVARVFERGDDLFATTDYTLDASRQQLNLVSPPVGQVLADVSTIGGRNPTSGDDLWSSKGGPFAGIEGGAITGITTGQSGGTLPFFSDSALVGAPPGGSGKPAFSAGVVFPNAAIGGRGWITMTPTLAAGATCRYQLQVIGKLIVSLSSSPADAVLTIAGAGYYEGMLTNTYGTAQRLYLIALGDGGSDAVATCLYARFFAVPALGTLVPATLEQALREIFQRARKGDWLNTDAYAIDSATGYAGIGYYSRESVTARQALATVLPSYCACEFTGLDGILRITRLVDPALVAVDFTLDDSTVASEPKILPDNAPALSKRMAYQPNAQVLSESDFVTDLVDVPPARRQELSRTHRGVVYSRVGLARRYLRAETAESMPSLFYLKANAQAEIDRVCTLYAVNRDFYAVSIKADRTRRITPGQACMLTYPRYGLAAGKPLLVISVKLNPVTGNTDIRLWG